MNWLWFDIFVWVVGVTIIYVSIERHSGQGAELLRKRKRGVALGAAIISCNLPFFTTHHFNLDVSKLGFLSLSLGSLIWALTGFLFYKFWQLRPSRKDPFGLGDWSARSVDKPKKTH